jgi:hypothetical protein
VDEQRPSGRATPLKESLLLLLPWAALSPWVWGPSLLHNFAWPIWLAALLLPCCFIGCKLAFSAGFEACPFVDDLLLARKSSGRFWVSLRNLATVVILQLAMNKVVFFVAFGKLWVWMSGTLTGSRTGDVLVLIEGALTEEMIFRLFLMSALIWLIERTAKYRGPASARKVFWLANSFQALLFGIAHLSEGDTLTPWAPWYLRILAAPQTWGGVLLGYLFRYNGVETAIAAHAVGDILFVLLP